MDQPNDEMIPQGEGSPVSRSGYTLTIFNKVADGNWVLYRDANLLAAECAA